MNPRREPLHLTGRLRQWAGLALLGLSLMAGAAFADPPGRVGRIADVEGKVWLFDAETNEWVEALRNRPITTGDRLSTDGEARGVLRIGPTNVLIDGQTEMEVLQLDDERVRLKVHSGSIALRLRTLETAREYQVLTNEATFNPDRAGHYRIDRRDDTSAATTWQGALRVEAGGTVMNLGGGQRGEFFNNGSQLVALGNDPFTDWVMTRETREERSVSAQYVSPEMTGAEDLDRYGRWEQSPDYGTVWIPQNVEPEWAPYSQGRWVSVAPWGWTWVDNAPWGFAPFHYGRWARYRDRWCWVPGTYVRRPVYAPALVAWVGGPQVNVSVNVGPRHPPMVGWFPLGPREVYVPRYHVSPRYVREVNIHHVRDVVVINRAIEGPQRPPHEHYVNRDVRNAVTVVPISSVGRGRPMERVADQGTIQQVVRGGVQADSGLPQPLPGRYPPRGDNNAGVPLRGGPQGDRPGRDGRPDFGPGRPAVGQPPQPAAPPTAGIPLIRDRNPDDRGGPRPVGAAPVPQTAMPTPSQLPMVREQREREREQREQRERANTAMPSAVIPNMPIPTAPAPTAPNHDWRGQRDQGAPQPVMRDNGPGRDFRRERDAPAEQPREHRERPAERAMPQPAVMPQREVPAPMPTVRAPSPPPMPAPMPQVQRAEPPARAAPAPAPAPQEPRKREDDQPRRDKDRRDRQNAQ